MTASGRGKNSYSGGGALKTLAGCNVQYLFFRHSEVFFLLVILRSGVTKNPMRKSVPVGRWILHRYAVQDDEGRKVVQG